jgi:hypothetical protein
MSAYAIPGFLFPPLPSSSFDSSITANNMMIKDSSGSMVGHPTLTTAKLPPPMIKITIQNTKIDAWRLIQSYLTHSSSNNNENLLPHSTGTPPTPSSSSSCLYTTPPASMQASYRWRRATTTATDHSSSSSCIYDDDDDSRVMVFVFHIVIPKEEVQMQHTSTRQPPPPQAYTITRTLQQIRQLQHDLIMEQHEHEQSPSDAGDVDELYTIPELPYILDHHHLHAPPHHPSSRTTTPESGGGGGGQYHPPVMLPSFTYLQDKLRLYVPMVENWLYRIAQQQQQQYTMLWSSSSTTVWMKFLQKSSGDDDDATLQREWQPPPYGTASPNNHSSTTTARMEPIAVDGRIQYCGNVQQEDHPEPFLSSYSPMVHNNNNNNNNKHGRPPRGGGGGRTTRHPFVKTTRRVVSMESIDEEGHRCKTNYEEDDDGMDL